MRRSSRRSTLRDLLLAFTLVGVILGGTFAYAGTWPPMVIVESGSMMHPEDTVPYGRFGTIDPGDVVLVKRAPAREDVTTWADGVGDRYGKPGEVLVFRPNNNVNATPVIHRAMAWVDVEELDERRTRSYRVHWVDGEVMEFGPEGIYLPELGFDEEVGFTPEAGYTPWESGWITKGDNGRTNRRADQANADPERRLTEIVQPHWVMGVARGEVPWVGLLRLALAPNFNQVDPPLSWIRVGNAYAPYDLWTMLGFCLVGVVLAPLAWDVGRGVRARLEYRRDLARRAAIERGEIPEEGVAFEPEEGASPPRPGEPEDSRPAARAR